VLIDFPSEIADQAHRHGADLTRLEHLLVTHSHGDHWFPYLLRWRRRPPRTAQDPPAEVSAPCFTDLPLLHVYGNAAVEATLVRELGNDLTPFDLAFHRVAPGERFDAGALRVTALPANHDRGREDALHYVLQDAEATVLYGLDGDTFLPEARATLRTFRFDLVILESTFGFGDGGNHRNFARLEAEARWLRDEGLLARPPGGRVVATHFSPHHCPPYARTEEYLNRNDIVAARDGLEISCGRGAEAFP
jgi:phosphoribosyl 1,2-cyclic phosphate phosphodiesterase